MHPLAPLPLVSPLLHIQNEGRWGSRGTVNALQCRSDRSACCCCVQDVPFVTSAGHPLATGAFGCAQAERGEGGVQGSNARCSTCISGQQVSSDKLSALEQLRIPPRPVCLGLLHNLHRTHINESADCVRSRTGLRVLMNISHSSDPLRVGMPHMP